MPDLTYRQATVDAVINEFSRIINNPEIDTGDHAIDSAVCISFPEENTVSALLEVVPVGERLIEEEIEGEVTLNMNVAGTIEFNIVSSARTSLSIETPNGWEVQTLSPEQQQVADRYATEAVFWLTIVSNGSLITRQDDPGDYADYETRVDNKIESGHATLRQGLAQLSKQATALANMTTIDGEPSAALLDIANTIDIALAKTMRSSANPRKAHFYHASNSQDDERKDRDIDPLHE